MKDGICCGDGNGERLYIAVKSLLEYYMQLALTGL
jgi:hypothetical protein